MPTKPSAVTKPPAYCRQKCKGRPDRAYVRIHGKKIMLGTYDTSESRDRYAELLAQQDTPPVEVVTSDPTVAMIMVAYLEFASGYFQKPDGRSGTEYLAICNALRYLRRCCGELNATEFGPKRLKEVRQEMISAGLSRGTINAQVKHWSGRVSLKR